MGCCHSKEPQVVSMVKSVEEEYPKSQKSICSPRKSRAAEDMNAESERSSCSEIAVDEEIRVFRSVYNREWDVAEELLTHKRHQRYASHADHQGRTALHWACQRGAPTGLVSDLLKACPDAALVQDRFGKTPAHVASEFASESVVAILLGNSPKAAERQDNDGRTPLHEALTNNRSSGVVGTIVDANQMQVNVPDNNGVSPIHLFFKINLGRLISFMNSKVRTLKIGDSLVFRDRSIDELYKTAYLLLRAEAETKVSVDEPRLILQNWSILQGALTNEFCPYAFVEFVLRLHPEQGRLENSDGDLPIHAAAAEKCSINENLFRCDGCGNIHEKEYVRSNPRESFRNMLCSDCVSDIEMLEYEQVQKVDKSTAVISAIVSILPETVCIPNEAGIFALNIAIGAKRGWNNGLQELCRAAPLVLQTRDINTHMFPFMLAAAQREDGEENVAKNRLSMVEEDGGRKDNVDESVATSQVHENTIEMDDEGADGLDCGSISRALEGMFDEAFGDDGVNEPVGASHGDEADEPASTAQVQAKDLGKDLDALSTVYSLLMENSSLLVHGIVDETCAEF